MNPLALGFRSTLAALALFAGLASPPETARKAPDAGSTAPGKSSVVRKVDFKVRLSTVELPGAMDTGLDKFSCHAVGPKEVLARVRRVEYLLDPPVEAPRDNAYYYEGVIERSKWPLAARVHWSDKQVTTQEIKRP